MVLFVKSKVDTKIKCMTTKLTSIDKMHSTITSSGRTGRSSVYYSITIHVRLLRGRDNQKLSIHSLRRKMRILILLIIKGELNSIAKNPNKMNHLETG
jgi:hypothetical protein